MPTTAVGQGSSVCTRRSTPSVSRGLPCAASDDASHRPRVTSQSALTGTIVAPISPTGGWERVGLYSTDASSQFSLRPGDSQFLRAEDGAGETGDASRGRDQ